MMRARTRWLTLVSLAALLVAGCGNASGPATSPDSGAKAGGKPGPIAITVADSQPPDRPSNLPLAEFKRQVEQLSSGTMTVTILTEASQDADPPGSDEPIIDKLKSGAFQMAVVPARAWSAAGVTSLKALQAPFLFESDEHVAAVVNDPAITKDLFSGLDGSGVTGLTLFPESLRHLFSFGPPMLSPADVKGKTIRAISSLDTTAIIEALGGTAVDPAGDAYQQGVDGGTIQGTDSGFPLSNDGPNRTATATGNVAIYAKVMTLAINTAFWTALDDAQRAIITTASDATRTWAIANQTKDAAAAAVFCNDGGTVVLADTASVAAFRAAEAPVYAALEADPATKRAIAAIAARATGTEAAPIAACRPVIDATTLVPDGGDLPNGIYRVEFTDAFLTANGVTDVPEEHGVWTFRLENGHWTMDQVADNPLKNSHLTGEYQVKDREMFWMIDNDSSGRLGGDLIWSVNARGDLGFETAPGAEANWWFGLPWARVGDLTAGVGGDQAALDGVYRYEVTERYLLDHGVEANQARDESGVHTLTMSHGKFTDAWVNGVADGTCAGVFTIEGQRVTLRWTRDCTGDTRATYEREGDTLRWSQVESLPPHDTDYDQKVNEAFWGVPYTRVGDAP
jgi:TRAP-type C4-dicarboxylate transport system substrate-binding protein